LVRAALDDRGFTYQYLDGSESRGTEHKAKGCGPKGLTVTT
jgi:hypothetical protein